jgi:protein Tex
MLPPIEQRLAIELAVRPAQVIATIELLNDGATVPFIARYRKEITGGLDDTQLRQLLERLTYLRELEDRRATVINSIQEQGKLTDELKGQVENATTKQDLEDIYLPYKQKRRTKAQIAKEAGIEPLATDLLSNPNLIPEEAAISYIRDDLGFGDVKAVLDGARQILMERFAEDAKLIGQLRQFYKDQCLIRSELVKEKELEGAKYQDWFDFSESYSQIPSHRSLALLRGRNEGFLKVGLVLPFELDELRKQETNPCEQMIARQFGIRAQGLPADKWLADTVRWTWKVKVSIHLELDLMGELKERAEEEAIRIFGQNLKDLLLAAPAGQHITMGIDPGIRTGCKIAVVDATGKLLDTATIYPHEPRKDWDGSIHTINKLCTAHQVTLIAIGNGTASRETDKLVLDTIKQYPSLKLSKIVVSEAGASVYSASELAAKEFPNLDVSIRGAVSIARRLQDPLAELVKIDPKSIGVGQYQHDVSQTKLAKNLEAVVEDCVNAVGVDVNTASIPLLARVSGLNNNLAMSIVQYRDEHGAFKSRSDLHQVPRLGNKTFEQAAGFLRIPNGADPLDASSVHPEAYPLVEKIISHINRPLSAILGKSSEVKTLSPELFVTEQWGLPTVIDVLAELEKPGRDPRPEFKTAQFDDSVQEMKDLKVDMILEGVVTNVAAFGAFVDIGVHQDGLVHVSALSNNFVKDPHSVVKAGQIVKVKVVEVDIARKRIALTMRLGDTSAQFKNNQIGSQNKSNNNGNFKKDLKNPKIMPSTQQPSAMASAFAKLKTK